MAICYIGIGSNLGDRRQAIRQAIKKINSLENTSVIRSSRIIETKPLGGPMPQPKFLNAAIKIKTTLTPLRLLKNLKSIEQDLGRRKSVRWGPRIIDLDILFYDHRIVNHKDLLIPHPRVFVRKFVLRPLLDLVVSNFGCAGGCSKK